MNRVVFIFGFIILTLPATLQVPNNIIHIILGAKFWIPLARISFCVYLTHYIIILVMSYSAYSTVYLENSKFILYTTATIVYSFCFSVFVSGIIEVNFM